MEINMIDCHMEQYKDYKSRIQLSLNDLENKVIPFYEKNHSINFMSKYKLRKFLKEIKGLKLIPDEQSFLKIISTHETYDFTVYIIIKGKPRNCLINFPIAVDISKLAKEIKMGSFSFNKVCYKTSELVKFIPDSYYKDFELDDYIYKAKLDELHDEKSKNPIIVMSGNQFANTAIINGNHRIMLNKAETTDIYVVEVEQCFNNAITDDYKKLYLLIKELIRDVRGIGN